MTTIEARCTQCASTDYGSPETNGNRRKYTVDTRELKHGTGRSHGTEWLVCPQCSGMCSLDECKDEDPCEDCAVVTLHNRAGSSVPKGRA